MNKYLYILIMALTTFLIRMIPLTLFRKKVKSRFIRSFLYYVPYVTLAAMTFPAIMDATSNWLSGVIAMVVAFFLAFIEADMIFVAVGASLIVFLCQLCL